MAEDEPTADGSEFAALTERLNKALTQFDKWSATEKRHRKLAEHASASAAEAKTEALNLMQNIKRTM